MTDLKEIITSDRTEGMVNASALNYQESKIFHAIQNSQALEYDRIDAINTDLALQLSPFTATWGLIYWETSVGLVPQPLGAYEKRRPPILARLANEENFGAEMIHRLAENFGEKIRVEIDTTNSLVMVVFQRGVPTFLEDFIEALENIIHAHLGREYKFEYHINTGVEIETAYNKYLYALPKAGGKTMCGTLPNVAVCGKLYKTTVTMGTDYHSKEQNYKTGGCYAAGPMPFVAIDGRIYSVQAAVEAGVRRHEQSYTLAGTTESGTVPDTVTEGRQYSTDVSADQENHSTDETYKRCNQIYSGGEPIK